MRIRRIVVMRGLVALSVALNLFFLAFVGARMWHAGDATRDLVSGVVVRVILQRVTDSLPPDDGRILQQAAAARLDRLSHWQQQSREAAEQVRRDIAATPFDLERTRADLLAARQTRQQLSPVIEDILLDALPRMSDEGRRVLSEQRLSPVR